MVTKQNKAEKLEKYSSSENVGKFVLEFFLTSLVFNFLVQSLFNFHTKLGFKTSYK